MSRRVIAALLFVAALLGGVLLCPPQSNEATAAPPRDANVVSQLTRLRDFEALEDGDISLGEFCKSLNIKLDVEIDIDEAAFAEEGMAQVDEAKLFEKRINKMRNVTLEQYLRKVLSRLPSESGATFWVRKDRVEITTWKVVRAKIWGDDHPGPFYPLVNASFHKETLAEIAQKMAELYEINVVVDSRVQDKAKTEMTQKFTNTPLDTALKLLADQADLQIVAVDNVIYVTTPERAAKMKATTTKERNQDDSQAPTPGRRIAPGPLGKVAVGGMG